METDRLPETSPGMRAWHKVKALGRFWAQFVGAALVVTLLFGPIAPVVLVALVLTLGLPVLALVVWGQSLDEELGWGEIDDGPW